MKVTVYSKPDCVQCDSTKRFLDRHAIAYETIDLTEDAEAMEFVRGLGYVAAPVVVTDTAHWSGFRNEKLRNLVAEVDTERAKE